MLGIAASLQKGGASLLTFVKDNLKLYLDFNSKKSDTLKFPSEGSTEFDGVNDRIDCGQIDVSGQNITFSAWIYRDGTTDDAVVGRWNSNGAMLYAGGANIMLYINGNNTFTSTPDKTWFHIAGTFDGVNRKIYKNGVLEDTDADTGTIVNPSENFEIGNAEFSSGKDFKGKLANVAMWSRALTQEEVQSIMNKSYSQLKGVEKTSLVSWWALDDTVSTEKITNGDFSAWTNDNPDGWTISTDLGGGAESDNVKITEDANGARIYSTGTNIHMTQNVMTIGATYEVTIVVHSVTTGDITTQNLSSNLSINSAGTHTVTTTATATGFRIKRNFPVDMVISSVSVKEVQSNDSKGSNNGVIIGATTTTSVYGGHAPILPRAVDVAKEGQADAIGNGSASFDGNTDRIVIDKTHVLGTNPFTMTAWARNTVHGGVYKGVVSMGSATTNGSTYVGIVPNNKWGFGTFSAINQDIAENTVIGQWEHLAVTNDGTNIKMYFNGILKNSQSVGSLNITDHGTFIGGIANSTSYPFDGDISQVGIWQGALTQTQIQSVMESTSYSKIPADVKSTLGTDFFTDSTFDLSGTQSASTTGTHWTTGSAWTIANGEAIYDATAHENRLELPSATFQNAGLYKFSFTVSDANTKAGIKVKADGNDIIATDYYDNGDHVIYYNQTGAYGSPKTLKIEGRNDVHGAFKLQNVSWKLVTNDLVAYYPLDGDSSANGVTQDVTTGETLGSELISNGSFDTDTTGWIKNNGSMDVVNGELKVITSSSYWEGVRYNFGAVVSGRIYKAVFTARLESGNSPQIQFSGASGSSTYSNATSISGSSNVTYTFYFSANANNSNTYLTFFNGTASSSTFYLDNVSLKQVTSNIGVLK